MHGSNATVLVLASMMALVPALGVPSELVLQDTLKSALVALGVLIAAMVFVSRGLRKSGPVHWHGLVWLPLALCAYALGSMVWSHTYLAAVEATRWALLSLLLWLGLNAITRENVHILVWGIHTGAVGASMWTAAQFWGDLGWIPQAATPASTFVNRNFFAEYAVCALPFSVLALVQLRAVHWRQLMALSLAFNVVALMMTGTRSALIALLVVAPTLIFIVWRYRLQLAWGHWSRGSTTSVVFVFIAGILTLGVLPSHNTAVLQEKMGLNALERSFLRTASVARATEYTEGSFSIRAVMWKASARMLMGQPWTGVGAGAWEVKVPLYQDSGSSLETDYYAHNEYLQLLAEYGAVVGGGFLAVLFAYLLLSAGRTWKLPTAAHTPDAALRAIALTSLLALLIVSNAGFPWRMASTGAIYMLCLALLAATDSWHGWSDGLRSSTYRWATHSWRAALVVLAFSTMLALWVSRQAMRAEAQILSSIGLMNRAAMQAESDPTLAQTARAQAQVMLYEGIALNPHYRKLSAVAAEQLIANGDWANATWALESIAASRPHIANVWANLVMSYSELGQEVQARHAWQELQRLQPNTPRVRALDLRILQKTGHPVEAISKLNSYFDEGVIDYDLTQLGYALGLQTGDHAIAARALQLRASIWPELALDSYFRLGHLYSKAGPEFQKQAISAFQKGLNVAPAGEKGNYHKQVPAAINQYLLD